MNTSVLKSRLGFLKEKTDIMNNEEAGRQVKYKPRQDSDEKESHEGELEILDPAPSSPRKQKITDLAVFEQQLNQLQDQLVTVMIENQELSTKLKGFEDKESMEKLDLELEIERNKYSDLMKKYSVLETKLAREHQMRVHSKSEDISVDQTDSAVDKTPEEQVKPKLGIQSSWERFWQRVVHNLYEAIDDFAEEVNGEVEEVSEGDPLTVKTLKENIKRFTTALQPYVNTVKGINNMLSWKSPAYTGLVFIIYMWSVWTGWFLPLFLLCLTFRLFINFLQSIGYKTEFDFFDGGKIDKEEDVTLGISDKFNLVLLVARKVQNGLGSAADSLEKVKSLLTWRHSATRKIFFSLFSVFMVSCYFPIANFLYVMGLFMGVKVFIVNYFYNKYPRLKQKYDSATRMWKTLPTDADYEHKLAKVELDKYVLVQADDDDIGTMTLENLENVSSQNKEFCQLFSLPVAEAPLIGWHGGRRCSLINKDKAFANRFKNGKLYLTRSFICFERRKSPSMQNIVIPLTDIIKLEKCKPYAVLPGNGMAIEIVVKGNRSFIFGGILSRDEAFEHIRERGMEKMLPWACGAPVPDETDAPSPSVRRRSVGKFKNFSMATEYESD